jgi:hypothetical protein
MKSRVRSHLSFQPYGIFSVTWHTESRNAGAKKDVKKKDPKKNVETESDSSSSSSAKTNTGPKALAPGSRSKAKDSQVEKPKKVEASSSEEESESESVHKSKGKYAIMPAPGKKGVSKAKQKSDESSGDETDSGEDQKSSRKTLGAPAPPVDKGSSSAKVSAKVVSTKPAEAPTHDGAEINATKKRRTTQSGGAIVTATTHASKASHPAQRSNERFKRIDPEKYQAHVIGDNEYRAKVCHHIPAPAL